MIRSRKDSDNEVLVNIFTENGLTFLDPNDVDMYVYEDEGVIAGALALGCGNASGDVNALFTDPIIHDGHAVGIISALAVAKSHQNKGIGGKLVEHVLASKCPCDTVILAVASELTGYYEQFGFEPLVGVQLAGFGIMQLRR